MLNYGTRVVAGVTPGKGGQQVHGVPVFDTVKEAVAHRPADMSIMFVPARFAKGAALEALDAGLNLVIITEGIPQLDAIQIMRKAGRLGLMVIGPNTPGIISVGESKVGIMPAHIFKRGDVGIVSRSGTLTYEIVSELSKAGLGQSTVVGIGGDPVIGIDFIQVLKLFEADAQTARVVLIGEIGGDLEERAAKWISHMTKPLAVYIAGRTAPAEKRMGHAGAIISAGRGTAQSKIRAFEAVGVPVARLPSHLPRLLRG
jgi:succinyl-CoA synthetase alpha subunit